MSKILMMIKASPRT